MHQCPRLLLVTVGLDNKVLLDCIACIRQYLLDFIAKILKSRLFFDTFSARTCLKMFYWTLSSCCTLLCSRRNQ